MAWIPIKPEGRYTVSALFCIALFWLVVAAINLWRGYFKTKGGQVVARAEHPIRFWVCEGFYSAFAAATIVALAHALFS